MSTKVASLPQLNANSNTRSSMDSCESLKKSNVRLNDTVKEFTEDVDILGLKFLCRENTHLIRKCLYLVLVLLGSGFAIYQIVDQVTLYLSWPVSIRINISYVDSLQFPAVTICNYNRYRKSEVPPEVRNSTNITEILLSIPDPPAPDWNNKTWTVDFYRDLAHQKNQTIIECEFERMKCDVDDLTLTVADMGICYSFNAAETPKLTSSAGENHGVRLVLDAQIDEYLRTNVQAGFKILLEEADDPALVKRKGAAVPIGLQTNIAVNVMAMQNLPPPWENCTNMQLKRYVSYSRPACHEECFSDFSISKCKCQELYMNDSTNRFCSPSELALCGYPAHSEYTRQRSGPCSCPDPCHDKVYQVTNSQSSLTPDFYMELTKNYGKTEAYWKENIAIVEVYYPDLIEENVVHQASFSIMTLFCNIGGVFGLVLGAGLISVIEIFDFFITKSVARCKK